MLRPLRPLFLPIVAVAAVSVAVAVVGGCDPVGFWDGVTNGGGDGDGGEGEGGAGEGEGGAGEGEGEGDPGVLPPAPTMTTTTTDDDLQIEGFALNSAGIGNFLFVDPFVDGATPRRLLFGTDSGSSFTQELIASTGGGGEAALVIDSEGRPAMWTAGTFGVSVAVRHGPQDWQSDAMFSSFEPSFVAFANVAPRKSGGFVAIVATAVNTDSSTDPGCPFNITCRDYGLSFVEGEAGVDGEPGAFTTTSIASRMGDGLGSVRAGVDADDNPVLAWVIGQQAFVARRNADGEFVAQPVVAGVDEAFPALAIAPNGDVHIFHQPFGGEPAEHAFSTSTGFVTESLPQLPGYVASIDADDLGTLHMACVARTDAGDAEVHYVRARGDLFDDVVAGVVAGVDPSLVGVYPIIELGADGPHFAVGFTGTYIKPAD